MPTRHTQRSAEQRIERDEWMQWRIRRYGYPCLTMREYEAMCHEVRMLQPGTGERAVQRAVAGQMKVSEGRVSQLLSHAERAMLYFEEHGIPAMWLQAGREWRLIAPVGS